MASTVWFRYMLTVRWSVWKEKMKWDRGMYLCQTGLKNTFLQPHGNATVPILRIFFRHQVPAWDTGNLNFMQWGLTSPIMSRRRENGERFIFWLLHFVCAGSGFWTRVFNSKSTVFRSICWFSPDVCRTNPFWVSCEIGKQTILETSGTRTWSRHTWRSGGSRVPFGKGRMKCLKLLSSCFCSSIQKCSKVSRRGKGNLKIFQIDGFSFVLTSKNSEKNAICPWGGGGNFSSLQIRYWCNEIGRNHF